MKRTPLKRKTGLKRAAIKRTKNGTRKKRSPHKIAKDKAWAAFSKYIRLRDALKTMGFAEKCKCVTCHKIVDTFSSACHAGHWLGGRKGKNLFEENACHAQCAGCNLYGAGQQTKYEAFMVETYGHEEMDRIVLQANTPYKHSVAELEELAEIYKRKYEELGGM